MSVYIRQNSSNQSYTKNTWCILNPIEQSIKEKIERIGTPLKDWDINIYRGVLTGLNEAFIIDGTKKDELIAKDPKSVEIIRPILRGRDIKRYSYDFADKYGVTDSFNQVLVSIASMYSSVIGTAVSQSSSNFSSANSTSSSSLNSTLNSY